jgi:NAD(P)-dependent dehydrogenase (short-subunit alcohol dehydrogenase family)
MNKVALITGTSTGIGLSTAILLAQAGFRTIATMRDPSKAAALRERAAKDGVEIEVRQLDVQDSASVDACIAGVLADFGRIDVLVNNAGAGCAGSLEQLSIDDLQRSMDVNFFGVCRTTHAVLPAMRSVGSGRIITVSSVGGLVGQVFNDAYCAAKFAVEGLMESLAPVVKRFGIHVSLIEPGPVKTEFIASVQRQAMGSPRIAMAPYGALLNSYIAAVQQAFATLGQTGDDVAKVIVEAATAAEPHFRYTTSEAARGFAALKYVDPTGDSAAALAGARLP